MFSVILVYILLAGIHNCMYPYYSFFISSTESTLLRHHLTNSINFTCLGFPKPLAISNSFVFTTADCRLPIFNCKLVSFKIQVSSVTTTSSPPISTLFVDIAKLYADKPSTCWELQGGISKKEVFPKKVQDSGTN